MLLVLLSWCWIGISAYLWGTGALYLVKRCTGYTKKSMDMTLLLGLCLLTVYAQIFSLFYKVGALASMLLLAGNVLLFFLLRSEILQEIKSLKGLKGKKSALLVLCILGAAVLILSSGRVTHYDTYLYHAQSIHWIEEYGIVPGLGNLHNRLAYNSSMFSLQALFSLSFLVGQSLHSVNGFVALVLLAYAVLSVKAFRQHRFFASDFIRLTIFILYNDSFSYVLISSPGSDFPALGLVAYIFVKWVSYLEEKETETAPYACLSLLAVFAVSVKLSAAMVVLLALAPAVRLIRQKRWKQIVMYLAAGSLIIAPFLARNVIISGYLLYPYETLDLFSFDWKMPAYTLAYDRNEIKAWGWGLKDVYLFDTPIREWFPVWFSGLEVKLRILFGASIASALVVLPAGVWSGIKKKSLDFLLVSATMLACLGLWFLGSPSPRYGIIYMALLPLLTIGWAVGKFELQHTVRWMAAAVMAVLVICSLQPMAKGALTDELTYKKRCADYDRSASLEYMLDNQVIYVPEQGDQAGYYAFPSTPYPARLERIEMRGGSLAEGFRMREEYRNAYVSTYGEVFEENMFR